MKSFTATFALATLIAAMLASCSSTPVEPGGSTDIIIPLAIGNTWIGDATEYDASGSLLGTSVDTLRVVSDTMISGERRFRINNGPYAYVNRQDGVFGWQVEPFGPPLLMFRYPAVAGDHVEHAGNLLGGHDTLSTRVISTNENVTVPAGTFTCYHYVLTASFGQNEDHFYLAPKLGFVKIESVDRPGDSFTDGSSVWKLRERVLR